MLALSLSLHVVAAVVLLGLQRGEVAEPPVQQVALVWAEQAPGAGDPADSATQPDAAALAEQTEAAVAPAEEAMVPPEPEPPAAAAEPAPPAEPVAEPAPPLPPPPAPRAPARPAPAPVRSAAAAAPQAAATAAAAAAPMAMGAGQALGAVVPARLSPGAANAPPTYPQASRLRNEQGRVTLQVEIDPLGRVADLQVMVSSGFPALDQAAMAAVRRWQFQPAQRDGQPVLSTTAIGITFQLEGDRRW